MGKMNRISLLPIFLLTMCAPAPVTPPAEAIPQEQMEQIWEALEYMREYDMLQNRTEPDEIGILLISVGVVIYYIMRYDHFWPND